MSDFVLRGFCKNCNRNLSFIKNEKLEFEVVGWHAGKSAKQCDAYSSHKMQCMPVWFLSANQMKILTAKFGEMFVGHLTTLLEENPFLLARVLREAGEKK